MPARIARQAVLDIGSVRLTYLPDGATTQRPGLVYPGAPTAVWDQHREFVDEDGRIVMSFGAFLVESGRRMALVDLAWGPRTIDLGEVSGGLLEGSAYGGELLNSLAAVGVRPEDIDTVLYSHLHADHVGWASHGDEAEAVFPNATHLVTEDEWAFWRERREDAGAGAPGKAQLAVIKEGLRFVRDGDTPIPGLTVLATPGHTPGHCSHAIASGDQRAVILGDAVHCPVEFAEPSLRFTRDSDSDQAYRTRLRIAREFSGRGTVIIGPHFPEPVFGHLDGPELPQALQPLMPPPDGRSVILD